jgi:hypothetical protein
MESRSLCSKAKRNSQKFPLGRNRAPEPNLRQDRYLVGSNTISENAMIRKLKSGEYRLYSRKRNPKTGKRRNLGTFKSRQAAEKHERAVQFFKRGG